MNIIGARKLACILSSLALYAGASGLNPAWAATSTAMPVELRAAVSQTLRNAEPAGSGRYVSQNPENRLALDFDGSGLALSPSGKDKPWHWALKLTGYGMPGHLQPVGNAEVAVLKQRVEYRRGALTEWYENKPEGLEQGFTVARPPVAGAPKIELRLSLNGDLKAELDKDGRSATLRDNRGKATLAYRDLSVVDAAGKQLPAKLALAGNALSIRVDTQGAAWPIVVDPLVVNIQQKLTAQNTDGSGDEQNTSYFGTSAAVDGDTALIGAPYQNCVSGTDCGSAYVYTRSGTAWNIQQKLTALNTDGSDDTAALSHFGGSVALSGDTALVGSEWRDCVAGENAVRPMSTCVAEPAGKYSKSSRRRIPTAATMQRSALISARLPR